MKTFMIYAVQILSWEEDVPRYSVFKYAATKELAEKIIEDHKKRFNHTNIFRYDIHEHEVMTE